MRVIHLVPALFGPGGIVGGAERYALELARSMAEVTPTRLITFGDDDRAMTVGRLEVRVMGRPWRIRGQRNNCVHPRMFAELAEASVIHCHQLHLLSSSLSAVIARLGGNKVFVSDLGGGGWDVSAYVSTDRWYHGHLHISDYSRRIAGHEKWPRARVILGGVDLERFSPPTGATERRNVVFVGRLLPHKGVDDLVEAIPADLPLLLLGKPYDDRFLNDLKRLAAGKRVQFEHDAADEQIIEAYRNALCVVLPSVYRTRYGAVSTVPELLGQTLLEGMACGAPAICTDVASMPEVVVRGQTGLVVPPNNPPALRTAIERLRFDRGLVDSYGRAGRERVEAHFSWSMVVSRCLAAYTDH